MSDKTMKKYKLSVRLSSDEHLLIRRICRTHRCSESEAFRLLLDEYSTRLPRPVLETRVACAEDLAKYIGASSQIAERLDRIISRLNAPLPGPGDEDLLDLVLKWRAEARALLPELEGFICEARVVRNTLLGLGRLDVPAIQIGITSWFAHFRAWVAETKNHPIDPTGAIKREKIRVYRELMRLLGLTGLAANSPVDDPSTP